MDPYEHQETKKGLTQVNLIFWSASFFLIIDKKKLYL